ncbi:unnamed protein product [Heligmosomoides polygyrus]|uniref:Secreted protein n=1 Tax=Heligmosomoides polygyrus TaxID=6339 RepID=A0A183FSY4_HELPZ|nr:unnamed protein product [Heligmosomoides polygyrus]
MMLPKAYTSVGHRWVTCLSHTWASAQIACRLSIWPGWQFGRRTSDVGRNCLIRSSPTWVIPRDLADSIGAVLGSAATNSTVGGAITSRLIAFQEQTALTFRWVPRVLPLPAGWLRQGSWPHSPPSAASDDVCDDLVVKTPHNCGSHRPHFSDAIDLRHRVMS